MELGEHKANIKKLLKKNSLCGSILQSLFQIFKNWLKRISALTAYVWGAAPCTVVVLCPLLMKMQWQSLLWLQYLLACSSQPQFLRRMSFYTAQSCCLESSSHKSFEFLVWRWCCHNCMQSLKVVGRILLRLLSAGVKRFSGGMAGMWPFTIL